MTRALILALLWLLQAGMPVQAQQADRPDPHRLYEDKCAACHQPHAGDFVDARVARVDGIVVGLTSRMPLATLLQSHHGIALSSSAIAAIGEQLTFILQSGRIFREKCLACHDRAAELARLALWHNADGRLVGRYSHRDVQAFLETHGRLTPQEREIILDMLSRQVGLRSNP